MEYTKKLKRKEDVLTADMNGSAVTMDVNTGKYYNFGEVGGSIWNHLNEEKTFDKLVQEVADEYGAGPDDCRADILEFVEQLISDGLIEYC